MFSFKIIELPAGPGGPTSPAGPGSPTSPGGPTSPAGPGGPTSPAGPGGPTSPAGPGGPGVLRTLLYSGLCYLLLVQATSRIDYRY